LSTAKASKTVKITPEQGPPVPYDNSPEKSKSYLEDLAVAGNTAELKEAMGAELFYMNEEDAKKEGDLLESFLKKPQSNKQVVKRPGVALAASGFLRTYGQSLANDVVQQRSAIKNKLFEIANCGDPRYELKALELLGKTSDLALFTERSEINITHSTSESLENAIKERVKRLLNAEVIDITPMSLDDLDEELASKDKPPTLDDELGVFNPDEEKINE